MRAHPKRTKLNQTVELLTLLKKKTTPCFPFSPLLTNQQKTGKTLNGFFHISSYGMPNAAPTIHTLALPFAQVWQWTEWELIALAVAERKWQDPTSHPRGGGLGCKKNPLTTRLGWLPSASATVQWTSKEIWSARR